MYRWGGVASRQLILALKQKSRHHTPYASSYTCETNQSPLHVAATSPQVLITAYNRLVVLRRRQRALKRQTGIHPVPPAFPLNLMELARASAQPMRRKMGAERMVTAVVWRRHYVINWLGWENCLTCGEDYVHVSEDGQTQGCVLCPCLLHSLLFSRFFIFWNGNIEWSINWSCAVVRAWLTTGTEWKNIHRYRAGLWFYSDFAMDWIWLAGWIFWSHFCSTVSLLCVVTFQRGGV